MRDFRKSVHLVDGIGSYRHNLYRVDRLAGLDIPRLGEDPEANTTLLFNRGSEHADAIAAASDYSICGDPVEIQVNGCVLDSTTPFYDALAGNTVPATECILRWKRPFSVEQINPPPQLWTACDQANVDPADRSTWKPITMGLPPCEDYCTAEPFNTIMGLEVTLLDQQCRPERIEEMNRWIEVFTAIERERRAMAIFDMQVGASHHFAFDAASLVEPGQPRLGAMPALAYAVHAMLSRTGMDRHSPTQGWWAALHPSIVHTIAADMHLAGDFTEVRSAIEDMLRMAGVSNVIWTKDFGTCEGLLAQGYQQNAFLCQFENCDIPTYEDPANCTPFGGGVNLPPLVDSTRIRFFQPEQWYSASTFVVDYALRTSAEMMRQNRAEYFGETSEFLFMAANCHTMQFVLDCDEPLRERSAGPVGGVHALPEPGRWWHGGSAVGSGDLADRSAEPEGAPGSARSGSVDGSAAGRCWRPESVASGGSGIAGVAGLGYRRCASADVSGPSTAERGRGFRRPLPRLASRPRG